MNKRLKILNLLSFMAAVVLFDSVFFSCLVHASQPPYHRHHRHRPTHLNCPPSQLSATTYNLPVEGKTSHFRSLVHLNGTGILKNGNLIHNGHVLHRPDNCTTTNTSASGQCLLSYFGVAADLRYYRPGDIIFVPSLKGKEVRLPSGKIVKHPGYFIVQDTGGAIRGQNRFDFFIGTDTDSTSSFKDTGIGEKHFCGNSFTVIRKNPASPSPEYLAAYDAIYQATDSTHQDVGTVIAALPSSDAEAAR